MNIRTAVLAIPVVLGLGAGANAATVTLSPIGASHHELVAALGATCAVPDAPAQAITSPVDYPTVARVLGIEGTATVGISLSPTGRVRKAWSIDSTGNKSLDSAALDNALENRYVAERAQCNAVSGDYKLNVEFSLTN